MIADISGGMAAIMLGAVDVVTSFEGYHLLRDDQQLTNEQIRDAFTMAVVRLFAPPSSVT